MNLSEELVAEIAAAEAAGKKPDLEAYLEPQIGEMIVRIVISPRLMVLAAILDDHLANFLLNRPEEPMDIAKLWIEYRDISDLERVLREELRRILALPGSGPFFLRRRGDDLVLVMKVKTLSINVTVRRLTPDCANCPETDCPDRQTPMVTRG